MEINNLKTENIKDEGSSVRKSLSYRVVKRTCDIILSIFALVCLSPVFLMVFLLDKFTLSNRGPVLYKQIRVGLHGNKFGMYKFRSMIVGADKKLLANKVLYEKYVANNFKLEPKDDPRITKLGRVLRRTSIDEIPQFITQFIHKRTRMF